VEAFSKWVLENFSQWTALIVYLFVAVLSTVSGAVGHFLWRRQTKKEDRPPFSVRDLSLDLASSVLAGVLVFWLAVAGAMPPPVAAIVIAAVTLKGWEGLNLARRAVVSWLRKMFPNTLRGGE
jgi:amino acid transporter